MMQYFIEGVVFQGEELQSHTSLVKWHLSEDHGHTEMSSLRVWVSQPTVFVALDRHTCSTRLQRRL